MKPWHDAPPCANCRSATGTPMLQSHRSRSATAINHLCCQVCGHDWVEKESRAVAQAWYAIGAWHGKEQAEADAADRLTIAAMREEQP